MRYTLLGDKMLKEKKIYSILRDKKYHTSKEMADILNVSDRTIRDRIKKLKDILYKKGVILQSVSGKGYILVGNILSESDIFNDQMNIPNNSIERQKYIIDRLIKNDFIKIDDISRDIFTSPRSISSDIKEIKELMEKYDISIISKPHYGLTISGEEYNIRNFIISHEEGKFNKNISYNLFLDELSQDILNFIRINNIEFSDIAFATLVISIYVSFERIKTNKYISKDISNNINDKNYIKIKEYIYKLRDRHYKGVLLDDKEVSYMIMHFYSKQTINFNDEEIVEISSLINELMSYVEMTYSINLDNKQELYKNLYKHLLPLIIRMRFNIKLNNPLLDDIKENMPFSYNIAIYMGNIINKKYDKKISEDEIAYLAVIIEMSININNTDKKNILIICPMGRGTSKFLKYAYNKLFDKYINIISTCGLQDLDLLNLANYDLVFSVIDIQKDYGVKIHRVNCFLTDEDISMITNLLKEDENTLKYFSKDLFIHLKNKNLSKEEVIKELSDRLVSHTHTTFDIYTEVMKREKLGYTELYNNIAIPHPMSKGFGFEKIAIAVLDKPMKWNNLYVSIIFLMCIDKVDKNVEKMYSQISNFFYSKELLEDIIRKPTYDNFINILKGDVKYE